MSAKTAAPTSIPPSGAPLHSGGRRAGAQMVAQRRDFAAASEVDEARLQDRRRRRGARCRQPGLARGGGARAAPADPGWGGARAAPKRRWSDAGAAQQLRLGAASMAHKRRPGSSGAKSRSYILDALQNRLARTQPPASI